MSQRKTCQDAIAKFDVDKAIKILSQNGINCDNEIFLWGLYTSLEREAVKSKRHYTDVELKQQNERSEKILKSLLQKSNQIA